MSHAVYTRKLNRNRSLRKATVISLAHALLKRQRIQTTLAKAKEAQRLAEKLITLAKRGTLSDRRRAVSILQDRELVRQLFAEIAPRFKNRAGGYTRIIHDGHRPGDAAIMAIIELVERSEPVQKRAKTKEAKAAQEAPRPKGLFGRKPTAEAPDKEKPAKHAPKETATQLEEPPAAPTTPPAKKPKTEEKEKPRGLVDGLRKFFKRRDNP